MLFGSFGSFLHTYVLMPGRNFFFAAFPPKAENMLIQCFNILSTDQLIIFQHCIFSNFCQILPFTLWWAGSGSIMQPFLKVNIVKSFWNIWSNLIGWVLQIQLLHVSRMLPGKYEIYMQRNSCKKFRLVNNLILWAKRKI